jgi:hypothetical protein
MSEISVVVVGSTNISSTVGNGDAVSVNVGDQTIGGGNGAAATVQVGKTTTLAPTASATVVNVGTSYAAKLDFGIPQGVSGPANSLSIGSVTTVAPGGSVAVSISGSAPSQQISFVIPSAVPLSSSPALPLGIAVAGTSTSASRSDHVHLLPTVSYTALTNVPVTFAPAAHNHAASDVNSGVFDTARLPAATSTAAGAVSLSASTPSNLGVASAGTSTSASRSDHVHLLPTVSYTALTNVPATFAPAAHNHAASDVNSGVFDAARLPAASSSVAGAVAMSDATPSNLGAASAGTSLTASRSDHVHLMPTISYTALTNVPTQFQPPVASKSVLGGVYVGNGLNVSGSGVLSVDIVAPGAPTGITDGGGSVSWTASGTGTSATYDVQQTRDEGATYIAFVAGITGTSTGNFDSSRKFRVRARSPGGVYGPWGYQAGLTPQAEARNLTIGSGFSTTDGTLTVVGGGGGTSGASLSDATPSPLGTAAAGSSSLASRSDHVHLLPTISYTALTNVPATFAPAAHTQNASTITDFAAEAAKYGPVTSVNGATGAITIATGGTAGATMSDGTPSPLGTASPGTSVLASRSDHVHALPTISYTALTNVPTSFAPSSHTQAASTISDFAAEVAKIGNVISVNGMTGAVTITGGGGTGGASLSSDTPAALGTASAGSSSLASRADHVHQLPTISYTALSNVPVTFSPATHSHAATDVTSGVFASARLPLATTTAAGAVVVGGGIDVSSGTISVGLAPGAPTSVVDNGTDTISWTPSVTGTSATYEVQRTTDGGATYSAEIIVSTNSLYYFVLGGRKFRVRARNTAGVAGPWGYQSPLVPQPEAGKLTVGAGLLNTDGTLYAAVQSVAGRTGAITLTNADVSNVVASDPTSISGADAITNMVSLTAAEYAALGSKSVSTLYVIVG